MEGHATGQMSSSALTDAALTARQPGQPEPLRLSETGDSPVGALGQVPLLLLRHRLGNMERSGVLVA